MRLVDLDPRWIAPGFFAFRCPHCKTEWLTCKSVAMKFSEQVELMLAAGFDGDWVPANAGYAWGISGDDFTVLTVTPSIDASASGHWHGYITNGAIA